MMEKYEALKMEIVLFDEQDVIVTSQTGDTQSIDWPFPSSNEGSGS